MNSSIFRRFGISKLSLVMTLALFSVCTASAVVPSKDIINQINEEIDMLQWQLPQQAMQGMELYEVFYNPKNYTVVYRFRYTVPIAGKPTANSIKETKQGVIHMVKAHPESNDYKYMMSGLKFHYNYYDMYGNFVYAIIITADDFR